jgi:hypothetical protein
MWRKAEKPSKQQTTTDPLLALALLLGELLLGPVAAVEERGPRLIALRYRLDVAVAVKLAQHAQ